MVFQQEERPFLWLSPRRSSNNVKFFEDECEMKEKSSWFQMTPKRSRLPTPGCDPEQENKAEEEIVSRDPLKLLQAAVDYDALEYADRLEMGLSKEIVTDFMTPCRSMHKLQRYNVLRSEDTTEYRLLSDNYAFLLFARTRMEERRVEIFQYDPKEENSQHPFDPARPAFTLSWNTNRKEWRLVQERCEHCRYSPKHLSCSCRGKQQVACIRHFTKKLGDGVSNCMEVKIPGFGLDGSPVIWCPRLGRQDLASPVSSPTNHAATFAAAMAGVNPSNYNNGNGNSCSSYSSNNFNINANNSSSDLMGISPAASPTSGELRETETLTSKLPTWNEEFKCLVLDFEGRTVTASPHNFQLSLPEEPEKLLCQYGKIGPNTFSLDFKSPLSVIQAFGVSLSTMFLA